MRRNRKGTHRQSIDYLTRTGALRLLLVASCSLTIILSPVNARADSRSMMDLLPSESSMSGWRRDGEKWLRGDSNKLRHHAEGGIVPADLSRADYTMDGSRTMALYVYKLGDGRQANAFYGHNKSSAEKRFRQGGGTSESVSVGDKACCFKGTGGRSRVSSANVYLAFVQGVYVVEIQSEALGARPDTEGTIRLAREVSQLIGSGSSTSYGGADADDSDRGGGRSSAPPGKAMDLAKKVGKAALLVGVLYGGMAVLMKLGGLLKHAPKLFQGLAQAPKPTPRVTPPSTQSPAASAAPSEAPPGPEPAQPRTETPEPMTEKVRPAPAKARVVLNLNPADRVKTKQTEKKKEKEEEKEEDKDQANEVLVSAVPNKLKAGSQEASEVAIFVLDKKSGPVANQEVRLFCRPAACKGNLSLQSGTTGPDGRLMVKFSAPADIEKDAVTISAKVKTGDGKPVSGKDRIQVEKSLSLAVEYEDRVLDADGKDTEKMTVTVSRSNGDPISGEMVEAEVVERKAGDIAPSQMVSDDQGRAVFTYNTSEEAGKFTVHFSLKNDPKVSFDQKVEQAEANFYQVQLQDDPAHPVLRVYLAETAVGKNKDLCLQDIATSRVLNDELSGDYAGLVPEDGWLLAALVGKVGWGDEQLLAYRERKAASQKQAKEMERERQALTDRRSEEYDLRIAQHCTMVASDVWSIGTSVITALKMAGVMTLTTGAQTLSNMLSVLPPGVSDAKQVFDDIHSFYKTLTSRLPRLAGAKGFTFRDLNKKWQDCVHRQTEVIYQLEQICRELAHHWGHLENSAGSEGAARSVLFSVRGDDQTPVDDFFDSLLKLLKLQEEALLITVQELNLKKEGYKPSWGDIVSPDQWWQIILPLSELAQQLTESKTREKGNLWVGLHQVKREVEQMRDDRQKESREVHDLAKAISSLNRPSS